MLEVLLNQSARNPIITFHANTIEVFLLGNQNGGLSYHAGHLKSIEIITDKKGGRTVVAKTAIQTIIEIEVSEQAFSKAKELVTAVQEAMKTVRL